MNQNTRIEIFSGMYSNATTVHPEVFTFSGGESHVVISDPEKILNHNADIGIIARIQSSSDLTEFLMVDEIVSRWCHKRHTKKKLFLPYMPYARQDRITQDNSAFSLKVFSKIINSLGYHSVKSLDPHSDVTPALFDNFESVSMEHIISRALLSSDPLKTPRIGNYDYTDIVSPDAGAAKKVSTLRPYYPRANLVIGSKSRNPTTGNLTDFAISQNTVGENCIIFDDICDGGRTFIELAKILRERGAKKVDLYVTHAIMSRGLEVFSGVIDNIITTNSILNNTTAQDHPNVRVLDAVGAFA